MSKKVRRLSDFERQQRVLEDFISRVSYDDDEPVVESSAGGSMGGRDPRARGKMAAIVDSYGQWAKGKQSVCVKVLQTRHPEVCKGNCNALCAWLKDQWTGSTKWRGDSSDPKQKAEDAALSAKAMARGAARRAARKAAKGLTEGQIDAIYEMARSEGMDLAIVAAHITFDAVCLGVKLDFGQKQLQEAAMFATDDELLSLIDGIEGLIEEKVSSGAIAPKEVRAAFRRGLELYEDGRGGDGLVDRTIAEARAIAGGAPVTKEKMVRMRAWFARHAVDKRPGWSDEGKETPGYVAHMLWGGDAARSWVNEMLKDMPV